MSLAKSTYSELNSRCALEEELASQAGRQSWIRDCGRFGVGLAGADADATRGRNVDLISQLAAWTKRKGVGAGSVGASPFRKHVRVRRAIRAARLRPKQSRAREMIRNHPCGIRFQVQTFTSRPNPP
ncbi:hypothetical protein AAFF_G00139750 [Aldrovandia affinis]|uniref:Uncharacterized protein n=1 Tax=Aldrovandia affinis TaxID=143900 RepID=A0AAD7TDM5_9TELE|nr:hypothetical protein AAFF_G00139750 [Aldrovandia affinis]